MAILSSRSLREDGRKLQLSQAKSLTVKPFVTSRGLLDEDRGPLIDAMPFACSAFVLFANGGPARVAVVTRMSSAGS